jgi:hypothetical protein
MGKLGLSSFSPSGLCIAVVENVRLLAVSLRIASPSKSRVKISVRGKDYDTPSVTIATTVLLQYLTM